MKMAMGKLKITYKAQK